jgi:hypothetical protein
VITVTYRCACFVQDMERQIDVTERVTDEDLIAWMNKLQHAIYCDHQQVSPLCARGTAEYVKIPVDKEAEDIGIGIGQRAIRH